MRRSAMAAVLGLQRRPRPCPCRRRPAGRPSCRPRPAARSGRTRPRPCLPAPGSSARSASSSSSARFTFSRARPSYSCCRLPRTASCSLAEVLEAERLGQLVVDRPADAGLQRLGGHLEDRRLAGQLLGAVFLREGDVHGCGSRRRLMPSSCSVKPGMKPAPPTSIGMSVAVPPGKGSASPSSVPVRREVADRDLALGRAAVLGDVLQLAVAGGDRLERLGRPAPRPARPSAAPPRCRRSPASGSRAGSRARP